MPAAFLILSSLQPLGLHWLCAIVSGAPFTLLLLPFSTPLPFPHPSPSLFLYFYPSFYRFIWFFSMGKIQKTPFSNDFLLLFNIQTTHADTRTPPPLPTPRGGAGNVSAPPAAQPSSVFSNFFELSPPHELYWPPSSASSLCVHPTVWTITLHSIPKTSLWDCAMLADVIGFSFFLFCLLLIIGDNSLRYKLKKNNKKKEEKKTNKKEKKNT